MEREIIQIRVPEVSERLRRQLVDFIQQVRKLDIKKMPSISETIDWARVLLALNAEKLDVETVRETLHVFLKFQEDIMVVNEHLPDITSNVVKEGGE